tara:strand:+ start:24 stop:269 length:246 start_codon:yes stop_codon:yes gene_type:complete
LSAKSKVTCLDQLFSAPLSHAETELLKLEVSGANTIINVRIMTRMCCIEEFFNINPSVISKHLAPRGEVFDYEPVDELFQY